jgi:hypothetical protein
MTRTTLEMIKWEYSIFALPFAFTAPHPCRVSLRLAATNSKGGNRHRIPVEPDR